MWVYYIIRNECSLSVYPHMSYYSNDFKCRCLLYILDIVNNMVPFVFLVTQTTTLDYILVVVRFNVCPILHNLLAENYIRLSDINFR